MMFKNDLRRQLKQKRAIMKLFNHPHPINQVKIIYLQNSISGYHNHYQAQNFKHLLVKSSESKEKKMASGKLIANEAMKEGTVDAEVFKNYFNHFGWKSVIIILCLNITRFCLWMGENLWLASWSDDSKTLQSNLDLANQNTTNSTGNYTTEEYEEIIPVKTRLSVYSILGLSQAIFVVSQSLFAAKAGFHINLQI